MLSQYDIENVGSYLNYGDLGNFRSSSRLVRRSSEERFRKLKRELTPVFTSFINVYIRSRIDEKSFAIIITEPKRQIHNLHGYLEEIVPAHMEAAIDPIMDSVIGMLPYNVVQTRDVAIMVNGSQIKPLYVTDGTNSVIVDYIQFKNPEFIIVGGIGIKALKEWYGRMGAEKVEPFSLPVRYPFSEGKAILLPGIQSPYEL